LEITVKVPTGPQRLAVLGSAERNLKILREVLGVSVTARDGKVHISGRKEPVVVARHVLEGLADLAERGGEPLGRQGVIALIADESASLRDAGPGALAETIEDWDGRLNVYAAGRPVRPKTPNQEAYLQAIRDHDLVFGIGPAGTGKTYLAVAAAVHLLKSGRIKRVILTRPAVEAGEKLGFLPGDMRAKVNPYLRPLFDALADMMDYPTVRRLMDNDVVEVSPLAFMRGRTLNQAVVILDEAQNATRGQMQMFLTRLGHGSKMVVTGDITQTDLPDPRDSGLVDAAHRLRKTPGVGMVAFDRSDVVRHSLVQRIIDAYGGESASRTRRPRVPPTPRTPPTETRPDNPAADPPALSMT
jgi:phosphate starvation-inducible protein PhoH and related proteins